MDDAEAAELLAVISTCAAGEIGITDMRTARVSRGSVTEYAKMSEENPGTSTALELILRAANLASSSVCNFAMGKQNKQTTRLHMRKLSP